MGWFTISAGLYIIGDSIGSVIYYMKKKIANKTIDNIPRIYFRLPMGIFIFTIGIILDLINLYFSGDMSFLLKCPYSIIIAG